MYSIATLNPANTGENRSAAAVQSSSMCLLYIYVRCINGINFLRILIRTACHLLIPLNDWLDCSRGERKGERSYIFFDWPYSFSCLHTNLTSCCYCSMLWWLSRFVKPLLDVGVSRFHINNSQFPDFFYFIYFCLGSNYLFPFLQLPAISIRYISHKWSYF